MVTHDIDMLGGLGVNPDAGGFIQPDLVSNQLTLTNSKDRLAMVLQDPAGAGDSFIESGFTVPQNYVGTPLVVIRYIIDGTPASVVAFRAQFLILADSGAFDAAYGAQRLASNSTWTGYADEDEVEEIITPTDTFAAGRDVSYLFGIDDSVHTFTGNCLLLTLRFRYNDA